MTACADFSTVDEVDVARVTVELDARVTESGIGVVATVPFSMHNAGSASVGFTQRDSMLLDTDGVLVSDTLPVLLSPDPFELGPDATANLVVQFESSRAVRGTLKVSLAGSAETWPGEIDVLIPVDVLADWDQDGADHEGAGGDDCDDSDPSVYPGAVEIWYDGIDQSCDGNDADADMDGVDAPADCDDTDPAVSPSAVEIWYDGIDQDCDGNDADFDQDGYDFVLVGGTDCDDQDAAVHPSAPDGGLPLIDDDCDGLYDEDGVGPGLVVVSEVMRTPSAGVDAFWFEVANVSGSEMILANWTVHTDTGVGTLNLLGEEVTPLPSPGFLVVCHRPLVAAELGVTCGAAVEPWPGPVPGSDTLELRASGVTVDSVRWSPAWPGSEGVSMSLDPAGLDHATNDLALAWCASTETWTDGSDLGSPGEENAACP